jgi:hypothetical protein
VRLVHAVKFTPRRPAALGQSLGRTWWCLRDTAAPVPETPSSPPAPHSPAAAPAPPQPLPRRQEPWVGISRCDPAHTEVEALSASLGLSPASQRRLRAPAPAV